MQHPNVHADNKGDVEQDSSSCVPRTTTKSHSRHRRNTESNSTALLTRGRPTNFFGVQGKCQNTTFYRFHVHTKYANLQFLFAALFVSFTSTNGTMCRTNEKPPSGRGRSDQRWRDTLHVGEANSLCGLLVAVSPWK